MGVYVVVDVCVVVDANVVVVSDYVYDYV